MNAQTEFKVPAKLRALREIVAEYEEKRDAIPGAVETFKRAITDAEVASNIGGAYGGSIWGGGIGPGLSERNMAKTLLTSAWRHVYDGLNIEKIAPATERKQFDMTLENPPEFSLDNIRATFGKYLTDPHHHILRGLAEVFCDLDPAYKSHSKVKIGVEGLPKRIILSGFGEYSYSSWGQERLLDVLNALANYRGEPRLHSGHISDMTREARKRGSCMWWGGELRVFKNGNGHLIFDKHALREINLALAEFYGEVLPDVEDDDAESGDLFSSASTAVSKDLQFYWTPQSAAREVVKEIGFNYRRGGEGASLEILEPSCGDGRLMDEIVKAARGDYGGSSPHQIRLTGVEYHAERAEQARAKGHAVMTANFLETAPDPRFDYVVMNPPFYGLHWQKHLRHALRFLKRRKEGERFGGGTLICILPATAFYDGHLGEMGLVPADAHTTERGWRDTGWHDLPVGSFSESGTNVPTGFIVCAQTEG